MIRNMRELVALLRRLAKASEDARTGSKKIEEMRRSFFDDEMKELREKVYASLRKGMDFRVDFDHKGAGRDLAIVFKGTGPDDVSVGFSWVAEDRESPLLDIFEFIKDLKGSRKWKKTDHRTKKAIASLEKHLKELVSQYANKRERKGVMFNNEEILRKLMDEGHVDISPPHVGKRFNKLAEDLERSLQPAEERPAEIQLPDRRPVRRPVPEEPEDIIPTPHEINEFISEGKGFGKILRKVALRTAGRRLSIRKAISDTEFSEPARQLKSVKQALQKAILAGELNVHADGRPISDIVLRDRVPRKKIVELTVTPTDTLRRKMHSKLREWVRRKREMI